jgi:hypothetical protein
VLAETVYARATPWTPAPSTQRTSVVIDPRLALSPFGTMIVARLSVHAAVWLVPELHELLRSAHVYQDDAERLVPRVFGGKLRRFDAHREGEAIREGLVLWSEFFAGPGAALHTYHLGDSPGESMLPPHVDPGVHPRFERCARTLDGIMTASGYDLPRGAIIASCFRDATALATALVHTPTFILSCLEADERGAPAICNYLESWDLQVSDVSERAELDATGLRAVLVSAGLGPVLWSGVSLAAVHVVPVGAEPTRVFWHRL